MSRAAGPGCQPSTDNVVYLAGGAWGASLAPWPGGRNEGPGQIRVPVASICRVVKVL